MMRLLALFFTGIFFTFTIYADNSSPIGLWQIKDETTQQVTSVVSIQKAKGQLLGRVVKLYDHPNAICSKCPGELRDKPVLGMTVLWGFTGSNGDWTDGKILAVKRGSVFNADLKVTQQGQQLVLTVKTPLGTKNQIWQRVNDKT